MEDYKIRLNEEKFKRKGRYSVLVPIIRLAHGEEKRKHFWGIKG